MSVVKSAKFFLKKCLLISENGCFVDLQKYYTIIIYAFHTQYGQWTPHYTTDLITGAS